ncbi:hypothetical protein ACFLYO_07380, partial [Chloroflexota bacterium]
MKRLTLLTILMVVILAATSSLVLAQEEEQHHPIFTTASNTVGVGTYVAAQAYGVAGVPATDDAEAQPAVAIVMPYGI